MSENNGLTPEQAALLKNTEALLSDPEARSQFFGLLKKKNPEMVIPEHDVQATVSAALAVERAEREKLAQEVRDERTRTAIKEQRSVLRGKGLSDSDLVEVEKLMTEKGIVSHETAADYLLQSRQIAGGSAGPGAVKTPPIDPVKEAKENFGGDIQAWGRAKALEDLQAFKAGVRH